MLKWADIACLSVGRFLSRKYGHALSLKTAGEFALDIFQCEKKFSLAWHKSKNRNKHLNNYGFNFSHE